jgi:hypothetical protein
MKYCYLLVPLSVMALSTANAQSKLETIADSSIIRDSSSEKSKFYGMMNKQGWKILFNNPVGEEWLINSLRQDYEYKIMPRAWEYPDNANKPGKEIPNMESIWRKKKQPDHGYKMV